MNSKIIFFLLRYTFPAILLYFAACKSPVESNKQGANDTTEASVQQPAMESPTQVHEDSGKGATSTAPVVVGSQPENPQSPISNLTYTIIPSIENTFGYDIFKDGKLLIHQPSVPSLPGNKGCETQEQAESLAQLVISKINKGEMPPTISTDELKNLGIEVK